MPSPSKIGTNTTLITWRWPTASVVNPNVQAIPASNAAMSMSGMRTLWKALSMRSMISVAARSDATIPSRVAASVSSASTTSMPVRPASTFGWRASTFAITLLAEAIAGASALIWLVSSSGVIRMKYMRLLSVTRYCHSPLSRSRSKMRRPISVGSSPSFRTDAVKASKTPAKLRRSLIVSASVPLSSSACIRAATWAMNASGTGLERSNGASLTSTNNSRNSSDGLLSSRSATLMAFGLTASVSNPHTARRIHGAAFNAGPNSSIMALTAAARASRPSSAGPASATTRRSLVPEKPSCQRMKRWFHSSLLEIKSLRFDWKSSGPSTAPVKGRGTGASVTTMDAAVSNAPAPSTKRGRLATKAARPASARSFSSWYLNMAYDRKTRVCKAQQGRARRRTTLSKGFFSVTLGLRPRPPRPPFAVGGAPRAEGDHREADRRTDHGLCVRARHRRRAGARRPPGPRR